MKSQGGGVGGYGHHRRVLLEPLRDYHRRCREIMPVYDLLAHEPLPETGERDKTLIAAVLDSR